MTALGASSPARNAAAPSWRTSSTVRRFSLSGPTQKLDPRIHAIRRDIADISLADRVFAPHYARPLDHGSIVPRVAVRSAPSFDAGAVSELLFGEIFSVVDCSGEWAWGFTAADGYVGYVPLFAIGPARESTHIVTAPAALLFAMADIKAPVKARLPMGARLAVTGIDGAFLSTDAGLVHQRHVDPLSQCETDPVTIAERLIGTPYLWGGRSGDGIDCSGLVQLALAFCGIAAPRDSDQQQAALGEPVAGPAPLQRGDLVFWPGHVGLMVDADDLVHANAYAMMVTIEPLADVVARQPADRREPIVKRITP